MILACLVIAFQAAGGEPVAPVHFERRVLSTEFLSEGAAAADFDQDGHVDVASGPYIHRGPDFGSRVELYPPSPFDPAGYSDNFFAWPHDVDGDGWLDLFMVGFPGEKAEWFANPGKTDGPWKRHLAFEGVDDESPWFVDLTGDGKPELVCAHAGRLGWAAPDPAKPEAPWKWNAATSDQGFQRFTHGLGVGDVDGDGRADLLERTGWWRQPASLGGEWARNAFDFGDRQGGAQMFAYDVDRDGDNDVITSLAAHGFGLSWFEQVREAGVIRFVEHRIMDAEGFHFAELHALELVDVDRDGLKDIVTGKRWWSHGAKGDPMPGSPAVVAWFRLTRDAAGARFTPQLADDDSGVGTQVSVADVDLDGAVDFVIGNKRGTFVLYQRKGEPSKPTPEAGKRDARNLDLESGDLSHWTAEGEAFLGQPIRGDTVSARGREPSFHAGEYWIGGHERAGDGATGTLTSDWFPVEAPFASFLVGGGGGHGERVELWEQDASAPFFVTSGADFESMQRVVVSLSAVEGKSIRIRLVDDATGHWGHVNFDDWRFHAERPSFPRIPGMPEILERDPPKPAGQTAEAAARAMRVPVGFSVDVIAAEPDLHQPIALSIDARGRLWVAEAFCYPTRAPEGEGRDDIVVFEDLDHDGKFEKRTVFATGLNLVSGLEVGHGGVWVGAAPYLMFLPDANDDLVPDGPPEVLLDGWGYEDTHETLNAFTWGPDGWLYGCHGVFTHSRVGKPGCADEERTPLNAGIWRFHPIRREFEVFAWGTSNPWGVDFNSRGQAFATACVIPHLFHVVQGGRFERQAGAHFGAHVYDDLKTIADHRHYLGADPHGGNLRSDSAGGGHAHCGALIYLGDSFPARYRDTILFDNIHGNRINNDQLLPKGSGYVGTHSDDFLIAEDAWFRGINFKTGPDGSVYFIDWYDKQACHWTEPSIWDRTNGRLYRVRYGDLKPRAIDLPSKTSLELVHLQTSPNDFVARRARTVLAARKPDGAVHELLRARLSKESHEAQALRWLWTLHVAGGLDEATATGLLASAFPYVQAWTIQLLCERGAPSPKLTGSFSMLARSTTSPVVRLYLASAMQRLGHEDQLAIGAALIQRAEDADDHNLPLMIWYGLEPALSLDPRRSLGLARTSKIPLITRFILRRMASEPENHELLLSSLTSEPSEGLRLSVLQEVDRALAAKRDVSASRSWSKVAAWLAVNPDARVRELAQNIAVAYGDQASLELVRAVLVDPSRSLEERGRAVDVLARTRDPASVGPMLAVLAGEPKLRGRLTGALAAFDDPRIGPAVVSVLDELAMEDRRGAVDALCARASTARDLVAAIEAGSVDKAVIDALVARKLADLGDAEVDRAVAKHFGHAAATPEDKLREIAQWKERLTPEVLARADLPRGREVFARTCQQCHTLFGAGGKVGPDITGSNRADLDYLLTNSIDPSALVAKEYQVTLVWLEDERLHSGILQSQDDEKLTLIDQQGTTIIPRADVAEIRPSAQSMMPEGQLASLAQDEVRDLIAYLSSPRQTPIRASPEAAAALFDGQSLQGWVGDTAVWRVEDGAIVGKSEGLEHNSFLWSELEHGDFRLVLEVRLEDDATNSGIQFRSKPLESGEMRGYQADVGAGWWGALYEESGRGVLSPAAPLDGRVVPGGWNTYEIVAVGHRVLTAINGKPCVDLEDEKGDLRGVLALQVHSGGPTTVRFRNLRLELDPQPVLTTAGGSR